MNRAGWTTAIAGAALCGLIGTGAAFAQTAEPAQPAPPVFAPPPSDPPAPTVAQAPAADPAPAAAAAPADAAPADPAAKKVKPKKKVASVTTVPVTVRNSRSVKLVELKAGLAGSDKMKKIAGPLAPGKEIAARAPRGKKDCLIDVSGTFEDGGTMDATGFDACAQKLLNLTE